MQTKGCIFMVMVSPSVNKSLDEAAVISNLPGSIFVSPKFPGGSDCKESTCNAGDPGLIPGLGRAPGEEKAYPLQYSGLENSIGQSMGSQTVGHN